MIGDRRNAWGFSIFCDDIRQEIGGKLSVMGTYVNDMVFPRSTTIPLVLPKFCILVKYFEIFGAFSEDLEMRIFLPTDPPDAPTFVQPVPRNAVKDKRKAELQIEDDQERVFSVTAPITFAPFPIEKEGFLKVRMACGAAVTNLGSLHIRLQGQDENLDFT
ncbi:hypothetical protein [uncultured Bradyrhizobium sp.]|uniref:hypothetical protein n=1 Tax=Bradyrhizobium sp. TaxID=376 RepID=UPI0026140331|nr:hypothetical protein [uncultured Bradyrhizobium sp.]